MWHLYKMADGTAHQLSGYWPSLRRNSCQSPAPKRIKYPLWTLSSGCIGDWNVPALCLSRAWPRADNDRRMMQENADPGMLLWCEWCWMCLLRPLRIHCLFANRQCKLVFCNGFQTTIHYHDDIVIPLPLRLRWKERFRKTEPCTGYTVLNWLDTGCVLPRLCLYMYLWSSHHVHCVGPVLPQFNHCIVTFCTFLLYLCGHFSSLVLINIVLHRVSFVHVFPLFCALE